METRSIISAYKNAMGKIFTKRNVIGACAATGIFSAGAHFGFEQYENILENRGMSTLPEAENIFYPVTENGDVDWGSMRDDTLKIITLDIE